MVGWASYTVGLAALGQDQEAGDSLADREEARQQLDRALRTFREADDVTGYALVLDAMTVVALRDGDSRRAARLTGAVRRLEQLTGTGLNPWNRGVLHFDPDAIRQDPALADDVAAGAAMSSAEAVAYALGETGA
jgi:hypothetical protein